MRRTILIPLLVLALIHPATSMAQHRAPIDPAFRAWLAMHAGTVDEVDLYVRGDVPMVGTAVRDLGGRVKMVRNGLCSVRLPVDRVSSLTAAPGVRGVEFDGSPGQLMNDSMRVTHRLNEAQAGLAPLPQGYDGQDVIIGVIDAGLDHTHPDMRLADGRTRVLHYWDQTKPVNELTPEPYGYGQAWDSTQINAGLMTAVDQPAYWGHGTTVTGTAAGNGLANGRHRGAAPAADLMIVSLNFGPGNFRARVADAAHFIFEKAAALGKPAVINVSAGTYLGSHDGLDASALFIDDLLLAQGGRALVCAGGNSNNFPAYHLHTEVGADTTFTWFTHNPNSGLGFPAVFFELWADQIDFNDVMFAVGADRPTPSLSFRGHTPFRNVAGMVDQLVSDTLWSLDGHELAVVQYHVAERDAQYRMQVLLQQPDSSSYRFRFMTTGTGRFDVWSSAQLGTSNMVTDLPTVESYPAIAHYVLPDNDQHIVDSWACSPNVITVANHYNSATYLACDDSTVQVTSTPGMISNSSSKGPARTGLIKPDIATSGDVTLTAAPISMLTPMAVSEPFKLAEGCMHMRAGGTSIASPSVTGSAALLMQQCPQAGPAHIKQALIGNAFTDVHTGSVPNNTYGHGKLDAFAALVASILPPINLDLLGVDTLCAGEEVQVQADGGLAHYTWSNGAEGATITVTEGGAYSVTGYSTAGCSSMSDTVHIVVHPAPDAPQVELEGDLLTTQAVATVYQWFLAGEPIPGANAATFQAPGNGVYAVQITDANGCTAMSAEVIVILTTVPGRAQDPTMIWPSPTQDRLFVRVPGTGNWTVVIHDAQGCPVRTERLSGATTELDVTGLVAGLYELTIRDRATIHLHRFVKLP